MVFDPPAHDELEAEHGPRDGRAENGAEPSGDARGEQLPPHGPAEPEAMGEPVGAARGHLHGGAFAARAAAEEVGKHRAQEHERGHSQWDFRAVVVDGVDDEVVAGFDRLPKPLGEPAERQAGHGQEVDDRLVAGPPLGRLVEQPEKHGRRRAADQPDERAEREPLADGPHSLLTVHTPGGALQGAGRVKA